MPRYKIDLKTFDFNGFFQKYGIVPSDNAIQDLMIALTDPKRATLFGHNYLRTESNPKGRCEELERIILNDAKMSFWYATNIIQDRWPEAENMIICVPELWDLYISEVGKQKRKSRAKASSPA